MAVPIEFMINLRPHQLDTLKDLFGMDIFDVDEYMVLVCEYNVLDIAKWLHENGVDIRQHDDVYIRIACGNGSLTVAEWLHEHGADVRGLHDECIKSACANGHLEVAKWLHRLGADVGADNDECAVRAFKYKRMNIIDWLHELGVDVLNERHINAACQMNNLVSMRWMHEHGADLNLISEHSLSAARTRNYVKMVQYVENAINV